MKLRCLFLLIYVFSIKISYAQSNERLKSEIIRLLKEQNLTGAIWSTIAANGQIIVDSHGYKNTKTKVLISRNDKVHVGSVSKTILAAGFLRMATLKLIHLDDPVKKYLPNLPLENRFEETSPVTIRHLLNHTSGLTDAKLWHIFSTTAKPNTPLETIYLNSRAILKIQYQPGSIYSYSNLGYSILGMVIEKITNRPYENYLDENFLKPLGMTNSTFHFISQSSDLRLAFGHFDNSEPVRAMPMYLRPAGQFTTTAEDIGKFMLFMMSDGVIKGKAFILPEHLKAVGTQKQTDAFKHGLPYGDALGAYSRDRYGVVGIAKNGNTLGFTSMIYMFPDYKKAFFIVFNMDSETANYDLFNEVLVKYLNLPTKQLITRAEKLTDELKRWKGYYIPVITKIQPFGLLDIVFSHTKVETSQRGALLLPFQGKDKKLIYQGKNQFSVDDRTHISHTFYISPDGVLLISDGVKTLKKVNGLSIIAIGLSLLLGIFALIYLFFLGMIKLVVYQLDFKTQPIFWIFIAMLILFISIAFISTQPFMHIGNLNTGNALLFLATLILPLFTIVSFLLMIKKGKKVLRNLSFWATILVLQFCMLLLVNNLLPIIMWK